VEKAPGLGATAEAYNPLGLAIRSVDAPEHGRHLVADGPHHKEDVSLTGREARQTRPEAVDVIVRAGGGHVLHPAACRHERVLENGEFARPPQGLIELGGEESAYSHSSPRFCQM